MNETETAHLAGIILDIFPKRGEENAIRLARAIRTEIIMILSGIEAAEMKQAAPGIPEGWTSADIKPGSSRIIEFMLPVKEVRRGFYSGRYWKIAMTFGDREEIVFPICWRDIPSEPKRLEVGDKITVTFTVSEPSSVYWVDQGSVPVISKSGITYGIKSSDIEPQEVTK